MIKSFKTLLMWIVLLALPVQGMAQASMFACHLKGGNGALSAGVAEKAGPVLVDHSGMDHGMHGMHAEKQQDDGSSSQLVKNLHGCCNCAPTCAAVLLPVTQASFESIQHDTQHAVSTSQLPHSADTRRIDRPPKPLAI